MDVIGPNGLFGTRKEFTREAIIFAGILGAIICFVVYLLYFANSSHGVYWLLAEFVIGLIVYWKSD